MIDKDTVMTATANILTPVSVGIVIMNPVTILTIISIVVRQGSPLPYSCFTAVKIVPISTQNKTGTFHLSLHWGK